MPWKVINTPAPPAATRPVFADRAKVFMREGISHVALFW